MIKLNMDMKLVRKIFFSSGVYDALLGLIFLLLPATTFEMAGVTPPNHYGYVQFPAALLIIFGIMFFSIAFKPLENLNLMIYGILLKISYCTLVFGYWFSSGIPYIWKPFAFIDLLFFVLFIIAYRATISQSTISS